MKEEMNCMENERADNLAYEYFRDKVVFVTGGTSRARPAIWKVLQKVSLGCATVSLGCESQPICFEENNHVI